MGVFRGEFFYFRLSIKFARVGVASNILHTCIIRLFKKGLP